MNTRVDNSTDSEVINLFSCSTQLSMKFQQFIETKMLKIKTFLAFKLSYVVFIMLINVKMPTIVGILTFMCMINMFLKVYPLEAKTAPKN